MYYRIRSQAPSPTGLLYLTASSPVAPVTVELFNGNDSQLWQPVTLIANGDIGRGVALVNKALGMALFAPFNNAPVQLLPVNSLMQRASWIISGSVISLFDDSSMNLNVSGAFGPPGPGSLVLAWHWNGGGPNERWFWEPADFK